MALKKNTLSIVAATLFAAGVGIRIATNNGNGELGDDVSSNGDGKIQSATPSKRSSAHGIESYVIFVKVGALPMFLVEEKAGMASDPQRLGKHISEGTRFIQNKYGLSGVQSGKTLTFLYNNATNTSGWNVAYPTDSLKTSATNEIAAMDIGLKELSAIPNEMVCTLGWLGYVEDTFLGSHLGTIDFSEMNPTNGCWLFR